MRDYSNKQYRLLKKLNKTSLLKSKLKPTQISDIEYLGNNGCISFQEICENDDFIHHIDALVLITPKGRAVYESYVRENRRWLIPVIISLIAIAISFFALYKSSQPIKIYLNNEITSESSKIIPATPNS